MSYDFTGIDQRDIPAEWIRWNYVYQVEYLDALRNHDREKAVVVAGKANQLRKDADDLLKRVKRAIKERKNL